MKEVFKFQEVEVHVDLSKSQVIGVLDSLESRADKFEKNKSGNDFLTIGIVNVGFYLDLIRSEAHKTFAQNVGYTLPA